METTTLIAAGWFGNKLLGETIDKIGNDLSNLYEKVRDKIIEKAIKKTPNIDQSGQTNLRVTKDVLWNGSFTEEEICAEYFGDVLASSRTEDGQDDSGIFFLDIIKSLSAEQLKMHYMIYRALNKIWVADDQKKRINPGQEADLVSERLLFPLLVSKLNTGKYDPGFILHGLRSKGLIGDFKTDKHLVNSSRVMPYLEVQPTSLGIQLFAIANNKLESWRNFSSLDFGNFDNIDLPQNYAQSLDELLKKIGLQ